MSSITVTSTLPAAHEVNITKGNTWDDDFTIEDETGSPVSLLGSTIECAIKLTPTGSNAQFISTSDGITITGGSNNIINIFKVISVAVGRYFYDILVTFPNGKKRTYVGGIMNVLQNIT